jgi:tRNA threonylcarbamoyladenosine biosynthesis protein TsaB
MLVLALDTTSRSGSIALARGGDLLGCQVGLPDRTHAERLPGDLLGHLARHHLTLIDVDLFAVAAGPGSFTGLRIGIATIQGLAFACRRSVVAVSALDALAELGTRTGEDILVAAWIDARRHEVFSALYGPSGEAAGSAGGVRLIDAAAVARAGETLDRWKPLIGGRRVRFIGDGAAEYRELLSSVTYADLDVVTQPIALAPAVAAIAHAAAERGGAVAPHAVRPFYVRRPDAEIARDGRALGDR